jgi:hypothetical protein
VEPFAACFTLNPPGQLLVNGDELAAWIVALLPCLGAKRPQGDRLQASGLASAGTL